MSNIVLHLTNSHLRNVVFNPNMTAPCLVAGMGMGGGLIPLILVERCVP